MKDEYEFDFKNFYYGKVRILWISQVALVVKNLPANAEDTGSIPGLGRAPRGGNGTPLQYFCLENSMDGGAWWAAVHGVAKSWARLSEFTFTFHFHALEKETATYSSVLAWRILGTAEPGGLPAVYGVAQSRTQLKRLSSNSKIPHTEKAMAPHSSILAWKIPWREEPGRLQSMG